ncbi:MAG: hypothetical protein JOZ15_20115 [Acidobacteria bacterium]|nr:hypothetical protein [Acidobacteriota bacterium]
MAAPPAAPPPAAAGAQPQDRVLDVTFAPAAPVAPVAPATGQRASPQPVSQQPASRRAPAPTAPPPPAAAAAVHTAGAARAGAPGSGGATGAGLMLWIAAAVLAAAGARLAWRWRPRRCASCRAAMRRLGREAAFAELDLAERTEHLVGDVHYEVWRCPACDAVVKQGTARDLSNLKAGAGGIGAPVGSAAFLRRRAQSGLSIWPAPAPADKPWPRPVLVPPALRRLESRSENEPPSRGGGEPG